jgi:hypothetical protein
VPFAVACVVGELKRYLRDATWRLHVPRPLKERSLKLCKAVDELPQRLGRSPTLAELAAHLGLTEEKALEALEVAGTRVDCSLDARLAQAEDSSLADLVAAPTAHESLKTWWCCRRCWPGCPRLSARWCCCASLRNSASTRSPPGLAFRRCTCRGCCAGPSPACASSSCPGDRPVERPKAHPRRDHPSGRDHKKDTSGTDH